MNERVRLFFIFINRGLFLNDRNALIDLKIELKFWY